MTNLAGHKFPSGVSFRRAFLNFQVLDASGNVLWASGNTNGDGVIVDNPALSADDRVLQPFATELSASFLEGLPHHQRRQVRFMKNW